MPFEQILDTNLQYYLINFDASGRERKEPDGSKMSQKLVEKVSDESFSDIFIFCHGWMGDIPAARHQYSKWIKAMAAITTDIEKIKQVRSNYNPLLVGVHWPSLPWGEEKLEGKSEKQVVETIVSKYSARIADTEAARNALRTIVYNAIEDVEPEELSAETIAAYNTLNQVAELGSEGEAGAPGDDREPFDAERIYEEAEEAEDSEAFGLEPGSFLLGRVFAPLRSLSYWKMKARARDFGESGGYNLLTKLQQAAPESVRFHLMGHSFGCIVMSAMLAGPKGEGTLRRPVNSLSLIQGALSLWSYCKDIPVVRGRSGYFYPLIVDDKIDGPIITTQSEHDSAVGTMYPLASGIAMSNPDFAPENLPRYGAIGAFGIRGDGLEIIDLDMLPCDQDYDFEPGKIYNLESSRYICKIPPNAGLGGAHSAINEPEVAHAVWNAAIGN